jgi:hypothetical protein
VTIRRWLKRACSPPSGSAHTRRGGSGSQTTSAPASSPRCRTATSRSTKPPSGSASPARRCCTRSNAASYAPSRSRTDGAKACESRCHAPTLDCLRNDDGEEGSVNEDPGEPRKQTLACSSTQGSWARCNTSGFSALGCAVQSKSSSVFRAGNAGHGGSAGQRGRRDGRRPRPPASSREGARMATPRRARSAACSSTRGAFSLPSR